MTQAYGILTTIDLSRAENFAQAQVGRLKCQDKNILQYACTGENGTCLKWKVNTGKQNWETTNYININETCNNDDDCKDSTYAKTCIKDSDKDSGYCGIKAEFYSNDISKNLSAGQCEVIDKEVCLKKSLYPYEKWDPKKGEYVSTTRPYKNESYEGTDYEGKCKPQNCDPDKDKNCSPTKCIAASCLTDDDCEKGTTGVCNHSTNYCLVDTKYSCSSDDDCGKGTNGCSTNGEYILSSDQTRCWGASGDKDPVTGESEFPAKECDPILTTGVCFETGPCPEYYLDKNEKAVYLEWHQDAGTCDLEMSGNTVIDGEHLNVSYKSCDYGKNSLCKKDKSGQPRCTCNHDDDCAGNSTCDEDNFCKIYDVNENRAGRCVYGNHILRQWAENPQCRSGAESNDDTAAYNHWNTLPPFAYDNGSGKMFLTDKYCWYGNMDWGKSKDGTKDNTDNRSGKTCDSSLLDTETYPRGSANDPNNPCTDIDPDWFCAKEYETYGRPTGKWKCNGPGSQCVLPDGWENFWSAIMGKTLYNGFFKTGFDKCDGFFDPINPKPPDDGQEKFKNKKINDDPLKNVPIVKKVRQFISDFKNIPDVVYVLVDPEHIKHSSLLFPNYVNGLDLVLIQDKSDESKNQVSLKIDQVSKKFPELIVTKNGKKYVKFEKNECSKSKELRKLYNTFGTKFF